MMIHSPFVEIHIAYEFLYDGPQADGQTYEPATLPSWEKALISASAMARLDGGRGNELLTQVRNTMKPA